MKRNVGLSPQPTKRPRVVDNDAQIIVCSSGENDHGQCGHGDTDRLVQSKQINTTFTPKLVSSGFNHTCIITEDNEIYCCGANESGQLGLGDYVDRNTLCKVDYNIPRNKRFDVASCNNHTILLTSDGELHTCGENAYGQLCYTTEDTKSNVFARVPGFYNIVSATCGGNHTLFLTDSGEVFGSGHNCFGQLGSGQQLNQTTPLKHAIDKKIIRMSTGFAHLIITTEDGKLYGSGLNHVVLNVGTITHYSSQVNTSHRPVSHLSDNNELYGSGSNEYGQLGLPSNVEFYRSMVRITLPTDAIIKNVFCHLSNSTAIMTNQNDIYMTGKNDEGQLGIGTTTDHDSFVPYRHPFGNGKVIIIDMGRAHALFLIHPLFSRKPKMGGKLLRDEAFKDIKLILS
ncbi:hypothetical protein AKO1_008246 [Acrasis kona]|uniref:Uncharacterized protein n=1 Tax=Acrasis kona TaxID=1008807 RepID=A0AAW2YQB7_9EUKA